MNKIIFAGRHQESRTRVFGRDLKIALLTLSDNLFYKFKPATLKVQTLVPEIMPEWKTQENWEDFQVTQTSQCFTRQSLRGYLQDLK